MTDSRFPLVTCAMLVFAASIGLAQPASAASLTFNTSEVPFTAGVANQGWWSATASNVNTSDNYFTGERDDGALIRSFFTFNLAALNLAGQTITAATLELTRYTYDSSNPSETIGFFDVSTTAATLNNNTGKSAPIFTDLGTGTSYGSFVVSEYTSSSTLTLSFALNAAALADIAAAAGGFFSIGGALTSITPGGGENEAIFTGSRGAGVQRLTITTQATQAIVPEPAALLLLGSGLAVLAAKRLRPSNPLKRRGPGARPSGVGGS